MKLVMAIAAGGAVGAVMRHYVGHYMAVLLGHGFPWGTLTVNVAGCFVMGVLVELIALAWSPSQEVRAFLTVGLLGALTTFSTFSLDVATLTGRGATLAAVVYIAVSVALSIGALFAGLAATRAVVG